MDPYKSLLKDSTAIIGWFVGAVTLCIDILSVSGECVFIVEWKWLIVIGVAVLSLAVFCLIACKKYIAIAKDGARCRIKTYAVETEEETRKKIQLLYSFHSNNVRVGTIVSVYITKEGPKDRVIAYGEVVNVNTPGNTDEIKIVTVVSANKELYTRVIESLKYYIPQLYILSNVYRADIKKLDDLLERGDIDEDTVEKKD